MSHFSKLAILAAVALTLPAAAVAHPGMRGYGAPASPVRHVVVAYDNGAVMDAQGDEYRSDPLPCARSYREDDYGTTRTVDVSPDRPTYGGACWLPRDTVETVDVRGDDSRDVVYDDMPPPPPPGAVPCTCVMTGGGYTYETRRPVEVRREVILREAPRAESYSSGYSASSEESYEESYYESSESRSSYGESYGYSDGDRAAYSETNDGRYDETRQDDRRDHSRHRRHHDRDRDQSDDRAHHDIWFNRY